MHIEEQIIEILKNNGASDVGFASITDGPAGLKYAVSIVLPLSDAVLDEIVDAPTHSYFHHYRTVNAYIDRLLLQVGLLLQEKGYSYIPIPASQSTPDGGERNHMGRYSHKKAAVLAGLGHIGKSTLFLHPVHGPRVRLGTLFTDCPLKGKVAGWASADGLAEVPSSALTSAPVPNQASNLSCGSCDLCVKACPAGAIKGAEWKPGSERDEMLDAEACNSFMREHFMKIGRGSVCGICVKVCPKANRRCATPAAPMTSATPETPAAPVTSATPAAPEKGSR